MRHNHGDWTSGKANEPGAVCIHTSYFLGIPEHTCPSYLPFSTLETQNPSLKTSKRGCAASQCCLCKGMFRYLRSTMFCIRNMKWAHSGVIVSVPNFEMFSLHANHSNVGVVSGFISARQLMILGYDDVRFRRLFCHQYNLKLSDSAV